MMQQTLLKMTAASACIVLGVSVVAIGLSAMCCKPPMVKSSGQDTPSCDTACKNLTVIGCQESQPTDSGITCSFVCSELIELEKSIDVECISSAKTKEEVRNCGSIRCLD